MSEQDKKPSATATARLNGEVQAQEALLQLYMASREALVALIHISQRYGPGGPEIVSSARAALELAMHRALAALEPRP